MHPFAKRRKAREAVHAQVALHIAGCEVCRKALFTAESLAKYLGITDRGAVSQALDALVIDGQLSKQPADSRFWFSTRTKYFVRSKTEE
jgi:hypothetical protein